MTYQIPSHDANKYVHIAQHVYDRQIRLKEPVYRRPLNALNHWVERES